SRCRSAAWRCSSRWAFFDQSRIGAWKLSEILKILGRADGVGSRQGCRCGALSANLGAPPPGIIYCMPVLKAGDLARIITWWRGGPGPVVGLRRLPAGWRRRDAVGHGIARCRPALLGMHFVQAEHAPAGAPAATSLANLGIRRFRRLSARRRDPEAGDTCA